MDFLFKLPNHLSAFSSAYLPFISHTYASMVPPSPHQSTYHRHRPPYPRGYLQPRELAAASVLCPWSCLLLALDPQRTKGLTFRQKVTRETLISGSSDFFRLLLPASGPHPDQRLSEVCCLLDRWAGDTLLLAACICRELTSGTFLQRQSDCPRPDLSHLPAGLWSGSYTAPSVFYLMDLNRAVRVGTSSAELE